MCWALVRFGIGLPLGVVSYVTGWPDMGPRSFSGFLDYVIQHIFKLFMGLRKAVISFFDTVSYFWDFARYDHPWWAFFISIALGVFLIAVASSEEKKG